MDTAQVPQVPTCPRCQGPMVSRTSVRGPFWGCKSYPRCRGTVDASAAPAAAAGRVPTPPRGVPADLSIPVGALPAIVAARVLALDPDQAAVADWRAGEGVAAAAAGSGKSTVLVERTADLIGEGVLPEAILILTFNAEAAKTLRGKLAARLGDTVGARVRALTYHAYGLALLRQWQDPRVNSGIIGTDDAPSKAAIFAKLCQGLSLAGEPSDWAKIDERVREAGIDPEATDAVDAVAGAWAGGSLKLADEIVRLGAAYAAGKRERALVDFTDLLCLVAAEFRRGTDRARAAACFGHVMVDEAQDTNVVQQEIARHLGQGARSMLWVGDLRQSIYGFRGAAPALLTDRVAAGAALLPIRTCRRSTAAIVEAGNAIARGREWHLGGDSVARPEAGQGSRPVARYGGGADAANQIASAVADGASPADFACLARVNSLLPDLECSLVARGLPVRVLGSRGGVWETQVGRMVRGYLHAAEGRATDDLTRIANRPLRFLKSEIVTRAAEESKRSGRTLVAALRAQGNRGAASLAYDLARLGGVAYPERCEDVAVLLLRDVEERAAGLQVEPDEDKQATIRALCKAATELGGVQAIEAQVKKLREAPEEAPAVTLSTCHRSKGAEYKHVFVMGVASGAFPHAKSEDVEEERRLFYVATTRAALTVTYLVPDSESPSTFLSEMGDAVDCRFDGSGGDGGGGGSDPTNDDDDGDDSAAPVAPAAPAAPPILDNLLAGPTPTDEEVGPDEEPTPGGKYVPVRLAAMRALLEPRGFRGAVSDRGNQYVFVKVHSGVGEGVTGRGITLRVYSSISAGEEVSREVGEDSIRVTAIWVGEDGRERPILPREAWVCRTAGWRDGILARVAKVEAALAEVPTCPACEVAPMRERSGARGRFLGCVTYPTCKGTRSIES